MSEKQDLFTHEWLLSVLRYDADEGKCYWIAPRQGVKLGAEAGTLRKDGRVMVSLKDVRFQRSRVVWFYVFGEWPQGYIDHIDGDATNDRLGNLRDVSPKVNAENKRVATTRSKLGVLGVSPYYRDPTKFTASIKYDGKCRNLGLFPTQELAEAAYLAAKRKHHEGCTV
jgi:hypothetical protein